MLLDTHQRVSLKPCAQIQQHQEFCIYVVACDRTYHWQAHRGWRRGSLRSGWRARAAVARAGGCARAGAAAARRRGARRRAAPAGTPALTRPPAASSATATASRAACIYRMCKNMKYCEKILITWFIWWCHLWCYSTKKKMNDNNYLRLPNGGVAYGTPR